MTKLEAVVYFARIFAYSGRPIPEAETIDKIIEATGMQAIIEPDMKRNDELCLIVKNVKTAATYASGAAC